MKMPVIKIAVLTVVALAVLGGVVWLAESHISRTASIGSQVSSSQTVAGVQIGGDFTLINQDGEEMTDRDFLGSYRLVYFGFTYCPMICPTELQKMVTAMELMGGKADNITPLFITIDPERDTPELVKEFVESFHPRMVGLTGTQEQIDEVRDAYRVYASKVQVAGMEGYDMNHSSYTFFMGPDGDLLTLFNTGSTPQDIAREVTAIMDAS